MSNDKHCERQCRRKSKGSCVKLIFAGLAVPKARPKGVVDGNAVNILQPVDGDDLVCCLTLLDWSGLEEVP